YYSSEGAAFLQQHEIATDAQKSYVLREPYGVWLAIMPWNFPFWQVIRCVVPAIMAGNAVLLKHASNVPGCAKAIEELFSEAGTPKGLFKALLISSSEVGDVLAHPLVRGVSLTGSEQAGRQVAAAAGRNIKPCVLELGGNNSFIVLADADIDKAVEHAIVGRFQNNGQSCIAAKRFLIEATVYNSFIEKFLSKVKSLKTGDPLNEETYIGPLARTDFAEVVHRQVMTSVAKGAKILTGGDYRDALYQPTILGNCCPGMPVMDEEVFGPVAAVMRVNSPDEAMSIVHESHYGLGVSIFSQSAGKTDSMIRYFDEGAVFINSIVKSDPRLPFGGVKASGFGRELSAEGILTFTYAKTVFIAD
ncbi:MAG: aldehyde dehydrogenase family protein, partial [Crocinitomicaceae bacterium]|nr:aldehyde dehydrogenase family protein [Crocinitomicaceae bacterium]